MIHGSIDTASALISKRTSGAMLTARQDRIPIWALPTSLIWAIGIGFLATFFCIFNINVSFIQTCTQIVPHCSPPTAENILASRF